MRIYLDESKQIDNGKIVVGGFYTFHNVGFIERFLSKKKLGFSIPENAELKSTRKYGKLFIEKLENDTDYQDLDIHTFGVNFENYYIESEGGYTNILIELLINLIEKLGMKKGEKVYIYHDNFNAKNNLNSEKKIEKILGNALGLKISFNIHNSKKYLGLQLADLIVGEYRKIYLYSGKKVINDFLLKNQKTKQ